MLFSLTIRPHSFVTEWKFGAGPQPPIKIQENAETWLAWIGRSYGESQSDLFDLMRDFENHGGAFRRQGRFLLIALDKKTGCLRVWTDKYRLLGACIWQRKEFTRITNNPRLDKEDLAKEWDPEAICDLLSLGYILPPRTLYPDIRLIEGFAEVSVGRSIDDLHQQDWRNEWPRGEMHDDSGPGKFYEIFRHATNRLVDQWSPPSFRMSAGADSRLIHSVLDRRHFERMRLETVCAPYLDEQSDRDVLGSRQIAEVLNLPLTVRHFPAEKSAYFFDRIENAPALSGLYGGEFLGGVCFAEDPAVARSPKELLNGDVLSSDLLESTRVRFTSDLNKFGTAALLTSIYLGSYRSAIYQSVREGWAYPSPLGLYALSPFSEQEILDFILRIPSYELSGYGFYRRVVLECVPDFLRAIPFSSPICREGSGIRGFVEGRDPKFRPHVSEETTNNLSAELLGRMSAMGLKIDSAHELLRVRLLNLQNALA